MLTQERARHLAKAIKAFPILGSVSADDLVRLVTMELGHPGILDGFQEKGDIRTKATAPATILHIVSGNTAHAGLQSLVRGLLLGARNRCKIPSCGLPEIAQFQENLPGELAELVEIESDLPEDWLREADAVIVFGSDETVRQVRKKIRPHQKFVPHGHRISFGILFDDLSAKAAEDAARDVSVFDQQGCLSPHLFYVKAPSGSEAAAFAEQLAEAMEAFNRHTPRRALTSEEANEIMHLRSGYRFRAASDPSVRLWCSEDTTDWTVVYETDPAFAISPLNRFVFVKPLPDDLALHLRPVRAHLSSICLHPFSETEAVALSLLGASRICPLGRAQEPSLFWHQDGSASLAPLVDWIDLG